MVGRRHFVDIEEDAAVADDVMCEIMHVVDGDVIAYVARDDAAVSDADRHFQIVILQHLVLDAAYADKPEKPVVFNEPRVKFVSDENLIPVGGCVAVLDETLHLVGMKMTPAFFRLFHLFVAETELALAVKILLVNEVFVYLIV